MIEITSPAFAPDHPIPSKYTQDGQNISPPLNWTELPWDTRELALIVEDPDAPKPYPNPFIHWVIYKIPPDISGLSEAIPTDEILSTPSGSVQGRNSAMKIGYVGCAPPPGHGPHHYHFRIFALDKPLELRPGMTRDELRAAMAGHIVEEGDLVGTYERSKQLSAR
ncbi:MAG TPA: YbhB/YbcL family Raf kinase inhibitor-like protein [Tepidisphaeraceae bacterium]|nr:YbhB/YbcL family Raf kinase inhibitor-like protein [Tepidisphaeraceae bacterium]